MNARRQSSTHHLSHRAQQLFEAQRRAVYVRTDRLFALLMLLQWCGAVAAAVFISPRTWAGSRFETHPHVWMAAILGGLLASQPVFLAIAFPGRALTRHVIASAQVLFSALLIHVTGGRIETHFHVFGSLAFLAFYRDWKVLIPATVIVAADHLVRGLVWPESVYGIVAASPWRWLEHAAWVLFEDAFLIMSCNYAVHEMRSIATRTAELEASYQSNRAIIDSSLDAVVQMSDAGIITSWNGRAEQTFGWTAAEALGRPMVEMIVPPGLRQAHQQGIDRYLRTHEARIINQRIEITALHRDGYEFPVEVVITPIHSEGTLSFCGFVNDITKRRKAEAALRHAKDVAEAASQAKSDFLANMSHEIRTPLNAILGFSELLLRGGSAMPAEHEEHLRTIHSSGRHLLGLVNDILDLSKIEAGQLEIERVRCSPQEIIAGVVSLLRVRAVEKGIVLESECAGGSLAAIHTDPARLRQLLMNLIGNAIKFTEQGEVRVVAGFVDRGGDSHLRIEIRDTGIGIPPEKLEDIFEPFVQADASVTRRFGGTGLGLTISRRIAAALGGTLGVQSELGKGSTFALELPAGPLGDPATDGMVLPADVIDAPAGREEPPRRLSGRVLLVEDGITNQKLLGLIMRRAGLEVTTADNGAVGVERAMREHFDVILMDMQMPVMDGYTATARLRAAGFQTPIIALTAHAMKSDERKCREAGCSGYLTKPISGDRLLATLATVLSAAAGAPTHRTEDASLVSTMPMEDPEFREIVEEFVSSLRPRLADMRRSLAAGDFTELTELAHRLKGAGGTVGFAVLSESAQHLEDYARAGAPAASTTAAVIDELEQLCRRIDRSLTEAISYQCNTVPRRSAAEAARG
jgi:PAS domain S-box-containing protein